MSENVTRDWWRNAAIYQVYPRSFADGNGDGIGDLAGIRERLGYLHDLGIDAIWFSPWYPSPMADAGYDVADYRDIDPSFGTLAEAEALIAEAHALGIRLIVDIVPNHCSNAHAWFVEALASPPGSPARDRFWFRAGRGEHGELPPNDWRADFGGGAWTRLPDGEWYLHLFSPEQPDFQWDNDDVRAEFLSILRFWFDRGIDGIRIDSATMCVKDPALPELGGSGPHPYVDHDGVHDVYRSWRAVADSYDVPRALIGEVWLGIPDRFARYLRPDEMHAAFNFEFLAAPLTAKALRACIDETLATAALVGAPSTWVLSNHDVTRHVTRYGRSETGFDHGLRRERHLSRTDRDLGTRRARAAALLTLALPGGVYVYQGEELGLPEVEDLPDEARQDPKFRRTNGVDPGRDGCRVPLPWSGTQAPFGFSPTGAADPWLPQPSDWIELTVEAQLENSGSMLRLYRSALAIRRGEPGLGDGPMAWQDAPENVLHFTRPGGFACVVNLSDAPAALPPHTEVLLTSAPLTAGRLPADAAAWLRTDH
ncbi:alpha-glucosidase [Allocatelliglobosispora scoriae]|uniref:Alpha-glucosidase n=1 Tax=Allocatelliglobosispora scoriae TaxID=643052 RepID=A0A841BQF9_9ACTN|nr:glycoside hydrolase family 13 protein [Allocatelliglobosispora scoriae]MBB5868992.1 alpha-glucosidase [Allocatelliglobosispora scoriae]